MCCLFAVSALFLVGQGVLLISQMMTPSQVIMIGSLTHHSQASSDWCTRYASPWPVRINSKRALIRNDHVWFGIEAFGLIQFLAVSVESNKE